jgi:serine/threonine protein kinase
MPATTDDRLLGGPYRLGEPLGHGGMGVVWAGRDELLGRDVAVKEVVPSHDLAADDREKLFRRTLREARAAARISSAAAVTVLDVVEEDARPWIVMERLAARSLADVIAEEGPLPARRAAELGLDVLDALQAAASVGVLHRDVKPANVMLLRSTGRAVLTDFGIATLEGDATVTTTGLLLGSPAYMSPERARGEPATHDPLRTGALRRAAADRAQEFAAAVELVLVDLAACEALGKHLVGVRHRRRRASGPVSSRTSDNQPYHQCDRYHPDRDHHQSHSEPADDAPATIPIHHGTHPQLNELSGYVFHETLDGPSGLGPAGQLRAKVFGMRAVSIRKSGIGC